MAVILALVISLIAVGGLSCGDDEEEATPTPTATEEATATPTPTKSTYKVGAVFAVTGNNAPLGTPEKQTVEMMVAGINARGGVNGHPLEVIIYDTETDSTKAVTLTNKLIEQDNVLAIIGPTGSGQSLAIKETITTAKIPLVSCAASHLIVTPIDESYWVFKTPQSDVLAVQEIYEYLQGQGIAKIAILTDTGGFGAAGKNVLENEAPDYGLTIVSGQTFGTSDTDMSSQITQIGGTDAEAIVCWGTNPGPAIIAKNLADDPDINIPLFQSHGIANKKFIELGGEAVNGVIFPAGKLLIVDELPNDDPQKEMLTLYKGGFEALYGEGTANTFGGHAFDALSMVVMALEAMDEDLGTVDARAWIRDYVEGITDFAGTGGVFNMSTEEHNGLTKGAFVTIKIVDGEWTWLQ